MLLLVNEGFPHGVAVQWFTQVQLKGPKIECSSWVGNQWGEKCGIEPGTGMAAQCSTTPTPYICPQQTSKKTLKLAKAYFLLKALATIVRYQMYTNICLMVAQCNAA